MTIRNYIRVLIYYNYDAITGWGVYLLKSGTEYQGFYFLDPPGGQSGSADTLQGRKGRFIYVLGIIR